MELQSGYLKTLLLASLFNLGGFLSPFPGLGARIPLVLAQAETEQPQAMAAVRVERRQRQVRQVQPENYSLRRYPITDSNESYWRNQLWTTALVEPQETYVAEAINSILALTINSILALTTRSGLSKSQMRTVETAMQVGTQLYLIGAYGQFPLFKLFLPFEAGVKEFLPGRKGRFAGTLAAYQSLLPPAWRAYFPIQQSYWAGKIGRSLFRIHGSGEAPDFFSGKDRYPSDSYNWNPTIGCLSALELYDEMGELQQADMPKILNTLAAAAGSQNFMGYVIVVEVPSSSETPISVSEIEVAMR